MSEMIERVARAIDPTAWAWIDKTRAENPNHAALSVTVTTANRNARAAIEAMREPTQPMVNAGVRGWYGARFGNCTSAYVAMIDAALNAAPGDPETAP